ncbi:MAG TPA: ribonuclease HI family protein [Candidatus Nitrosocosmicus sp.]|nr:ribonuclease HI family protein [Candidatus Nitrosocosmicus sp.]
MILKIHTDGGSKGNPGPSAIGVVFYIDEKEIFTYREDIGIATNNIAEYTAVIRALQKIKNCELRITNEDIEKIEFYSDSNLMVSQLNGLFKIKHDNMIRLIAEIRKLIAEIGKPITFTYVPREKNKKADELVNNIIEKS